MDDHLSGRGSNTGEICGLISNGLKKFRADAKREKASDDYEVRVKRAYMEMLQFCLWKPGVGPNDYNYVFVEMYDVRLRDVIDLHKSLAVEMETLSRLSLAQQNNYRD